MSEEQESNWKLLLSLLYLLADMLQWQAEALAIFKRGWGLSLHTYVYEYDMKCV
jgi:hypothetical protein